MSVNARIVIVMNKAETPKWNERDYAVIKAYEENKEKYKKNGGMLVYYRMDNLDEPCEKNRFFEWWNGKEWVKL